MKASKTFGRYFMEQLGVFKGLVFSLLIVGVFVLSSGVFSYALTIGHEILPGETSFTNSGAISAEDVKGDNATVLEVWGVYSDHDLELLENTETGAISALGQVGDAVSGNAGVDDIVGVFIEGSAATFTNAGEISADAVAGSAIGDDSYVGVYDIFGVSIGGDVGAFNNSGSSILVNAEIGDNIAEGIMG